jgi:hypothetical protein
MRSGFQKLLIGIILVISTGFKNNDPWMVLKDKTWRCNEYTGSEIIFYETPNGLRKAMLQIHGSGVPLAKVTLFDVEIGNQEIFLKDGMHQLRRNCRVLQTIQLALVNDSLFTLGDQPYRKKHDHLVALNWQSSAGLADTLNIERLKSISIDKKSIYTPDCFRN